MKLKVGQRLTSLDGASVLVIRAPADDIDLECAGRPMQSDTNGVVEPKATSANAPNDTQPVVLGKRYVDTAETVEVLVVKPGPGPLTLAGTELTVKAPKALPASD